MLKIILTIGGIQALAIAIQFIRTKVVAVLLGPEGVGVISTIDQTVQFAAFASALSIPLASVKFLSRAHSESSGAFKRTYAGFIHLLMVLSVAGTVISIGLVFFWPQFLGEEVEKYQSYLLIALFSLPTLVLGGFFTNVLASAQKYRASAALAVITNSATSVGIIAGVITAGTLGYFLGGSVSSFALTVGIILFMWKRLDLPLFNTGSDVLAELRQSPDIFLFTAMMFIGSISYTLSAMVARYAVLINFGEAEAGLLQGAMALSLAIGLVLNPANGLYLTPIMNRNLDGAEKVLRAAEFQRIMIFILALVSLPVVMFPQLMLTVMFSTKFASVGNLVFLFTISIFVKLLTGIYSAFMIGKDDLKAYALIIAVGEVVFILLILFLVPRYEIKGVAFGGIISNVAIFFASLIRVTSKHGYVHSKRFYWLLLYVLSVLVLTGLTSSLSNEWDATNAIIKICFFAGFALSLLLFLSEEEQVKLYGLRRKFSFGG